MRWKTLAERAVLVAVCLGHADHAVRVCERGRRRHRDPPNRTHGGQLNNVAPRTGRRSAGVPKPGQMKSAGAAIARWAPVIVCAVRISTMARYATVKGPAAGWFSASALRGGSSYGWRD